MNRKTIFWVVIALLILIAFFKHPAYFIGVVLVTWAIDYLHKQAKMGWAASLISWGVLVIIWVTFIAPMVEGQKGLWRGIQKINLNMARKTNSPAVEQYKLLFNYSVSHDSLQAEKLKKGLDSLIADTSCFSKDDSLTLRKIVLGVKDNATLEERLAKAQDPFPPEEKFQKIKEQLGDKWFEKEIAKLEKQKQELMDDTAKSAKDIETFLQEIEKVKAEYQRITSNQGTTDREKTSAKVDTLIVSASRPFPVEIKTAKGIIGLIANDQDIAKGRPPGAWDDNSNSYTVFVYHNPDGTVRFEAMGKIIWINWRNYKKDCDANGTPLEDIPLKVLNDPNFDFNKDYLVLPDANFGALVGKNLKTGETFLIGKAKVIG